MMIIGDCPAANNGAHHSQAAQAADERRLTEEESGGGAKPKLESSVPDMFCEAAQRPMVFSKGDADDAAVFIPAAGSAGPRRAPPVRCATQDPRNRGPSAQHNAAV